MRRLLATVGTLGVVGYGGAIGYLKVNEIDLVYHPAERAVTAPAPGRGLNHQIVTYASSDGTLLNAWVIRADSANDTGFWMLICHGNYGNIGYGDRPEFYDYTKTIGLNLLAFDYRGFGESAGEPEERGLYADAEASYRYLVDSLGVRPERVILFGHSLGSGVATELATRVPAAGLVVEGGYTSVPDRGAELYPWLPVRAIASQRFASIDKVAALTLPKVYLHSPSDDVIPFSHGEQVFAAAAHPKRFVSVEGGHMDAFRVDRAKYFGAIRTLVDSLRSPSAVAP
ncbi:MAG: alpha/beta hydrolase [Gemmatimonadetes bacterium]|nr:alpha/beta hydrolase [Gemmatimonadota bacterium]